MDAGKRTRLIVQTIADIRGATAVLPMVSRVKMSARHQENTAAISHDGTSRLSGIAGDVGRQEAEA